MPYELRIAGKTNEIFETQPEAVEASKRAITNNPEADLEVVDLSTGDAAAPGADKGSREDLRNKVGF